jgi:hypothetical protein
VIIVTKKHFIMIFVIFKKVLFITKLVYALFTVHL